ncbi:unnamed product [Ostreococcus tauri]|uniref:Unnamed product n=1 Tax=Ostreococcus tauri TaxID=70448 RepID=A0A096P895_OSTTA|nr:unnamed product [Ostreococcus tauri]CEG00222.1 unnamed product [Ostreococcus tauri]|eukprot:XP_022840258.1 unnamed product [Ostreococcus tauri]
MRETRDASIRATTRGGDARAIDPTEVLDPRVRGLLAGEEVRVGRGGNPFAKQRLSNKLWKLCVLFGLSVVLWGLMARQEAKSETWAMSDRRETLDERFAARRGSDFGLLKKASREARRARA